jgi:MFS family permease
LVFWASGFDMGVWASQIPRVKVGFSLSDSGLATIVLSFAIGAILTMPVTGALTSRLGGVRTVIATGLASAIALGLLGESGSYPWLLAATLFSGIAIGGLDVAMNTQATVIERIWGSPIMSGIHGWFSLGGLAGAAAGGMLTEASASFTNVLLVAAALDVAAISAAARWLGVTEESVGGGPGFAWPRRAVLSIGILCLLAFLIEGAIFDWSAVYMHETGGASLGLASAGLAGFSLSMAATRFAGDAFARRFGPTRVLIGGAGLAAFGIALACAVPYPIAMTAGFTLAGFGQANIVPLLFSAAGRVPNVSSGLGIAMAATMGYGAFVLGPPAVGFLADALGLRLALLLLVGCALAIAAGTRATRQRPARVGH